jgi:hypothetical protein
MHNRFTRVCYALAAAAAVTTTLGLTAASAASASTASQHSVKPNATSSCGSSCFNLYNEEFGPNLIQAVWQGGLGTGVGRKMYLAQASNSNMSEDFTAQIIAPVTVMCDNWPAPGSLAPNSYACLNYAFPFYVFDVVQAQYQPLGSPTNFCAGVGTLPTQGEAVTLRRCGGPREEWIADTYNFATYVNSPVPTAGPYVPWINAADTPESGAMVLTEAYSSKNPHHVLQVQRERIYSGGTVSDSQEWGAWTGTAP